jgi:hypothetical protein
MGGNAPLVQGVAAAATRNVNTWAYENLPARNRKISLIMDLTPQGTSARFSSDLEEPRPCRTPL